MADTPDVDADFPADYWKNLVQHATIQRDEPPFGEFKKLQTMNITHLLNKVARIKADIERDGATSPEKMRLLRQALHQYANAIRDYKFITELGRLPESYAKSLRTYLFSHFPELNNPHDTTYRTLRGEIVQNRDGVRELLREFLPRNLSWTDDEFRIRRGDYQNNEPPDVYSRFLESLARFIIGTLGGCALIVPILLMVLNPSLTKSLVVVSAAVVLFALCLSLVFETDNKDTITATATYAAVLVVFVGTTAGGSGSGG